jgi:hypothetical protein
VTSIVTGTPAAVRAVPQVLAPWWLDEQPLSNAAPHAAAAPRNSQLRRTR